MSSTQSLVPAASLDDLADRYNALAARMDPQIHLSVIRDSLAELEQLRSVVTQGLADKSILDLHSPTLQEWFTESDILELTGYLLQDIALLEVEFSVLQKRLDFADPAFADPRLADLG